MLSIGPCLPCPAALEGMSLTACANSLMGPGEKGGPGWHRTESQSRRLIKKSSCGVIGKIKEMMYVKCLEYS